jgi:hypothetical protein
MKRIKIVRADYIRIIFCVSSFFFFFKSEAQVAPDWKYKQELFGYLNKLSDSVYITDRIDLELLPSASCTSTEVRYYTATKSGEQIQLAIKSKPFLASQHQLQLTDTLFSVSNTYKKTVDTVLVRNMIDNTYAYGIHGNVPATEIFSFIILRNNIKLQIPKQAYSDLYNVHFCIYHKAPEVYVTKDNVYLYVYLHGSDGVSQYSVKIIFDKTGYVTRIVNKHPCLSDFDFIDGFGTCE